MIEGLNIFNLGIANGVGSKRVELLKIRKAKDKYAGRKELVPTEPTLPDPL